MAQRYVAKRDVFLVDRAGHKRFFQRNRQRSDGTTGYSVDEVTGLSRDQLRMFDLLTVTGETVESATAAPGEKRATKRPKPSTPKEPSEESEHGDE